jgi:hypothetical protein
MAFENVKCFGCQQYGHIERECPNKGNDGQAAGDDKPQWCGQCDKRTRLVYQDGIPHRCQCNPNSHLLPAQFRRCKTCQSVIYEWDRNSECGSHLPVSKPREYIPETERTK